MKASQAKIAWTPVISNKPTRGMVKIVDIRDCKPDWDSGFQNKSGAEFSDTKQLNGDKQIAMLFIEFNTLVVRDGIDPIAAHKAFLTIDEYCKSIALDQDGATADD